MTAFVDQETDLPEPLFSLQKQMELQFIERCALEREAALLRQAPPIVVTRPFKGGIVVRALRRVFPGLRRRFNLGIIRMCGLFDPVWYRSTYPDVPAGIDAAEHFLKLGAKELRDPGPEFETAYYLETYPDVAAAGVNPLVHFVMAGVDEGRSIRLGMPPREPVS